MKKIEIYFPTKKANDNFYKWFCSNGFDLFTKSKYNKLTKQTDNFITCLATNEKINSEYYIELE